MVAVSRFVEFSATGQTFATGVSTEAPSKATRGYSRGTGLATGDDSFTIALNSNDQLAVRINGVGPHTITLASGTDLDPRFVARDIAAKLHSANSDDSFKFAQCDFRNGGAYGGPNTFNSFVIYSGKLGNNGGNNDVEVTSPGARDARTTLGFDVPIEDEGINFATTFPTSAYGGTVSISGSYSGQFDDFYTIQISTGEIISNAVPNGGNTYAGTCTTDGMYVGIANDTYTVTIDTSTGSTMGAGSGFVPKFTIADAPGVDDGAQPGAIELLYPDHYYDLGALGVRVKFSDAVFGNGDTFVINAFVASGTAQPVGTAKYIWSSTNGDSSKSIGIGAVTTLAAGAQLGTKGLTVAFSPSGNLTPQERFHVTCRGPQSTNSNVTQLNFGNVTVSTNSPVKVVWFELISGAVSMSTVKFSLQSDGSFSHHDEGNSDTEFHYGTAGAGNNATTGSPTANNQFEFPTDTNGLGRILATDIDSDTSPSYLFATKADLAVVNSADLAQSVGNFQGAVVSDFMFLAIKLGANETGANSTINYRMFFDFS